MAGIVVSASKGVIDSVLAKLNELMTGRMLITVPQIISGMSCMDDIQFLWEELSTMNALLEKLEDADELDPQANNWRHQVREMTYDIEDCIDECTSSNLLSAGSTIGFINKISQFLSILKSRVKTAWQIKDLRSRLQEIDGRHKRYKIDEGSSSTTTKVAAMDPRLPALYKGAASLVGIENPKEELIGVMDKGQQLKVVSIVGFGGLGKTTLATEVHREVKGRYNFNAFVSVSQNPDMARILKRLLSQLEPHPYSHAREVEDLINSLREHLQDKRYFIIVDDLWDIRAWNIISCAFPQNNQRSIVMITTRNEDVARACCTDQGCIYNMKPLSEADSRKLFFDTIFGSKYACSETSQFTEVSREILKKCCGLPLAIITVASILACQPIKLKQQWDHMHNSLATKFATNSNFEDMMHILDLSYKNLPRHLKICFLYLGTYPEDHKISRIELVRRWVAEGFVNNSPEQDIWDVAESYFNELVNRSMIQPAYEDGDNIMISHCRVHDMMLDLIARRCREDNFITLVHDQQVMAEGQDKVIRRISANWSDVEDGTMAIATTWLLSHVRSVTMFGGSNCIPLLREFKFMRVLFLDINRPEMTMDLNGINQLALLRYLKVKSERQFGGISIVLPDKILRWKHLETLELPALSVCNIPSDIVWLHHLSHLVVPHDTELPDMIGTVKSLRTLDGFNVPTSSLDSILELGMLTNLRYLSLHCRTESLDYVIALGSSLKKLRNLKGLSVSCTFAGRYANALAMHLHRLSNLELLDLPGCTFNQFPNVWDLPNLLQLRLGVSQILQEDIGRIGRNLGSLVRLHLQMPGALQERIVIAGSTGFKHLKVFELECDGISYLTFEAGAMPSLWKLSLAFDPSAWDKATPVGLQYLASLKEIFVLTVRNNRRATAGSEAPSTSMSETAVIRGAFQEAADAHPGRPEFTVGEEWLIRAMESWRTL